MITLHWQMGKEVMKRIKSEEKKEKDGREKLKGKGGRK